MPGLASELGEVVFDELGSINEILKKYHKMNALLYAIYLELLWMFVTLTSDRVERYSVCSSLFWYETFALLLLI